MTRDLDFYDLLGVSEEASQEEIRKGFRKQVREYHPDLNDDPRAPAQFTALKKAYDTLADPKERDAYDRMGHEKYVKKRISGLPSPDDWQLPDRDEDGADDGSDDGETGTTTTTTDRERSREGTGQSGDDTSGTTTTVGGRSRTGERRSGGSDPETATTGTGTKGSGSGTERTTGPSVDETGDRSLGPDSETRSDAEAGTAGGRSRAASVDRARSSATTGAGTARDPDVAPPGGTTVEEPEEDEEREEGPSVRERLSAGVDAVVTSMFGWPMIVAADALFLASMGLYAAENAGGIERLVESIRRAGLDLGGLQSALGTRPEGFESLSAFIGSEIGSSMPVVGFAVLVAIAFLPSVYFFLVRWTRKNRLPWQPSYLYVLGALAPVAGLVLSGTVDPAGVYVEVFLYFLVPVFTIFSMLFFGQIKPRLKRVYRRWRYRMEG